MGIGKAGLVACDVSENGRRRHGRGGEAVSTVRKKETDGSERFRLSVNLPEWLALA